MGIKAESELEGDVIQWKISEHEICTNTNQIKNDTGCFRTHKSNVHKQLRERITVNPPKK